VNFRSSNRIAGALCLLAVSLLSSGQLLKLTYQSHSPDVDNLYLGRFDGIKSMLPRRGVVCYMPNPDNSFDVKKHYFLAQYALAPLVVRPTADCDPLIGDFPAGSTAASVSGRQFVVLKDFGNGLMLLRRNTGR
jgi:hypothetical protein